MAQFVLLHGLQKTRSEYNYHDPRAYLSLCIFPPQHFQNAVRDGVYHSPLDLVISCDFLTTANIRRQPWLSWKLLVKGVPTIYCAASPPSALWRNVASKVILGGVVYYVRPQRLPCFMHVSWQPRVYNLCYGFNTAPEPSSPKRNKRRIIAPCRTFTMSRHMTAGMLHAGQVMSGGVSS